MPSSLDRVDRGGLFFGLFGPLAVWRDGEPVDLGTPQQRRVLAQLVLRRNESLATDQLVDALWGEAPPPNAIQTVRTYVSRLRSLLESETGGGSRVVTHPGGYALRVDAGETDVELFETLARAGRAALDRGAPATAESRLREALALVRGAPLAGMEYDDFCRSEVERLEELRRLVCEDLVEARLAQGQHHELIAELRAAVAEHPLRERFRAQLMLALYRSGRQADALESYQEARRLLGETLGLEPSQELRGLERMILLQEQTLDPRAVGRVHGVPRHATSFIGRREEVDEIRADLGRERLVTLVGPAGTGKTRLAAEVASRLGTAFPDGIWWVDLTPADAGGVPLAFAGSLGVREVPGRPADDLVVERLRGARILLVADNCEHIAAPVAALAARVLAETDSARILATSREPLRIGGERVQPVPPLAVPPPESTGPDELMDYDAVRLFLARAKAAGEDLAPDEPTARSVARIVERLDGLPLAIELAAGKLRSLSLTELAGTIDQRPGLLGEGERTAPARHQTLAAAIEWSFDLLTAEERSVLLRLAAFPTSFTASAAEAVAAADGLERGAVLPALTRLVDKSLVAVEVGEPSRYWLLWTVRAFARERADATGELQRAARRHRDHFTALGEQVWLHLLDVDLAAWLVRARADQDNFRAALRWSLEQDDGDAALQLASALGVWWFRTGQLSEGLELLERALDLATERSSWRPRALLWLAGLRLASGAPDAFGAAEAAVTACEEAPELLAFALVQQAQAEIGQGRLDEAEATIGRARPMLGAVAHPELHVCDQWLGVVCLQRGDLDAARAYLARSVEGYRKIRAPLDAGWSLIGLARVELAAGQFDEAEGWGAAAVADFRARGDPRGVTAAFTCLGRAHSERGEVDRARVFLEEALELARRWGYRTEGAEAEAALDSLGAEATSS